MTVDDKSKEEAKKILQEISESIKSDGRSTLGFDEAYRNYQQNIRKTTAPSTEQLNSVSEETSYSERDTFEEALEAEKIKTSHLITHIDDFVEKEYREKEIAKKWFTIGLTIYFLLVTGFTAYVLLNNFSDSVKSTLIGGFFVNLIGLFAIVFKYIFSSSKELYDLLIKLIEKNHHKNNEK
ncbi:hypothetical protein PT287_02055 [Lactobacillus sp. ESL0679]|uniref:hypothetical protein n=1 Tax=unclassified Lactobacillus TaxID=2620435 RepID=UPI0023F7E4DA|nr:MULTISPECIES: hypothetical protein [unclassified Lactobacillus]MDF7682306.1 hypothetical protein [Lactobacillus sp. ESL0679]WEV36864.1 hypothetical protein OZX76_09015 [Lactobacillus sp. ESL0677]